MSTKFILVAMAILVGLVSGPSSLESAALSQPPLRWADLAIVLVGCAVALPLVLGFQALLGNDKALRFGWHFFALSSIYAVAAGISALATALLKAGIEPHSFLFLAMGAGLAIGSTVVRRAFARRFANGV